MTAPPKPSAPPAATLKVRGVAVGYGVLCHGLFAVGVATMILAMFFGMTRCLGRVPFPLALAANAVLLLQFPLAHSFLLSQRGRRIMTRLAPAGLGVKLAATTYVILASTQTLLLFSLWTPSGIVWWQASGWVFYGLIGLYTAAWLLLLKSIVDAGIGLQTGALGWWAVLRNRRPQYPPMPTRGLFRLSRQPIYLAFALTLWTVPTWTPDQLAVAGVLTAYCLIGPLFKEARFRRMFGAQFEAYSRAIPYWFPFRLGLPGSTVAGERCQRNDLSIYSTYATAWWSGKHRWLRTLENLVPARLAYFDRQVKDWRGVRVLDLGCGGGFMAEALARRGAIVTGVDPADPALASARMHARQSGLEIDYRSGSGEAIPAPDSGFDVVVCVDVLEHVTDLETVLGEIRRTLRPGGSLLFDTINKTWFASVVMVLLGERILRLLPRGTHDPEKFVRPDDLQAAFRANGFAQAHIKGFGPCGLNARRDLTFGLLPTTAIMYIGSTTARVVDSMPQRSKMYSGD